MTAWGNTTDRILSLLSDSELTKVEICSQLNLSHDSVSSVLSRLHKTSKVFGKRIYICGYTRTSAGKRYYLRPVFTAGSKKDKEKPAALNCRERYVRYRDKKAAIKKSNSMSFATRKLTYEEIMHTDHKITNY